MPVEDDPRRPRALVIDDNASVCEALCGLLWMIGFEAEGAMSGTQGLALFDQRAFDLVTTDLMMPGMTGWEVVEAVRTLAPATQIIMITGSVSNLDTDRARAMSLALLPKPLRLEDLRRALESDRSSTNAPVIGS
jgi:CheY-like chemotaxis protein